jgi:hypothetical protein
MSLHCPVCGIYPCGCLGGRSADGMSEPPRATKGVTLALYGYDVPKQVAAGSEAVGPPNGAAIVFLPEQLQPGDRLGHFNFMLRTDRGEYEFYETCGLRFVRLHWQTVNWLLAVVPVEKRGDSRNSGPDSPSAPSTEDAPLCMRSPMADAPMTHICVPVDKVREMIEGWKKMAGDIETMPNTYTSFMCCVNDVEQLLAEQS